MWMFLLQNVCFCAYVPVTVMFCVFAELAQWSVHSEHIDEYGVTVRAVLEDGHKEIFDRLWDTLMS